MTVKTLTAALAAAGLVTLGVFGAPALHSAERLALAAAPAGSAAVAVPRAAPAAPDFASIVERYGPAVVNITVVQSEKTTLNQPDLEQFGAPFSEFFRRFQPPVPQRGQGSGFIVSADGLVLTNAHVVADAGEVTVKLTDRREFIAKVVGSDAQTDIAVLRIDAKDLPTVKLGDPSQLRVGDWVLAIGAPYGFENSVSSGIVSAKSRALPDGTYVPFIQTDAAINPGNSGGPLFNARGEVVGINAQIYSRSGGYQGLAFAIPIDVATQVRDQLIAHGRVERGRIGVTIQELDQPLAQSFGLDRPRGALIAAVEPGGPAAKAGLVPGDIIVSLDGRPVERSVDLPARVAAVRPGTNATLGIWRKGSERKVALNVDALKSDAAARAGSGALERDRLGLAVRPLTPAEREAAKVDGGVLVEDVDGPAARAGVREGDLILSVNGTPVQAVDAMRAQVAKAGGHVALLIQRQGAKLFVPVQAG